MQRRSRPQLPDEAGWDAVVFVNRHVDPDDAFCGSGPFVDEIVAVCSTHEAFHLMFNTALSTTYPEAEPAIGDVGERISVGSVFDGWGYVHLFARSGNTLTDVDTFAIPQAHDPAYAFGFGHLSVHEVATDPLDRGVQTFVRNGETITLASDRDSGLWIFRDP